VIELTNALENNQSAGCMSFTNICFTAFQDEEPLFDPNFVAYLIYQRERCPDTGRLHWQGYCECHRGQRITTIQSFLGIAGGHIERRRGTQSEAIDYCQKAESRVSEAVEKGARKTAGAGTRKSDSVDRNAVYRAATAEPDYRTAMEIIRTALPSEYYRSFTNIRAALSYKDKAPGYSRQLEFGWRLPNAITDWLGTEFTKVERARCLVLIGGTRLGKTAWARSLGKHMFWRGQVNLGSWEKEASYIVFDDIPWKFIPQKKSLLTQMGDITVTDKYVKKLNVCNDKPAIVLLNEFDGFEEEQVYWEANTTVVRLERELFDRTQRALNLQADELRQDLNESFSDDDRKE